MPLTITDLKPGDHLCCLYDREGEHRAVLTLFLRKGLEENEKVLCLVDAHGAETLMDYLRADGLEPEPHLACGRLAVRSCSDTCLAEGTFDPDRMVGLLTREIDQAMAEGHSALRVTAEMSWLLGGCTDCDRLADYEARLDRLLRARRCVSICLYDRRRFPPSVLLEVLRCHPLAAIGAEVHANRYYLPPAGSLTGTAAAAELRRTIDHLRSHDHCSSAGDMTQLEQSRESLHLTQFAVDCAADPIFWVAPDGGLTYVNEAACRSLGYSREELLAMRVPDIDPLFPVQSWAGWWERSKERRFSTFESLHRRKDGSVFPVEVSINLLDYNGHELHIAFVRDISERKETERKLKWEAAVNAALADLSRALITPGVSIRDVAERVLDHGKRLTGSTHGYVSALDPITGDMISYTLTSMMEEACRVADRQKTVHFPKDPDGKFPSLWGHALNHRTPFYTNQPAAHAASKGLPVGHIPIERFLSVPAMASGELVGQIALANPERDYGERELAAVVQLGDLYASFVGQKRREIDLEESEASYRTLAENLPGIVYRVMVRKGNTMRFFNDMLEKLTGYTVGELTQGEFCSTAPLIVGEDRGQVLETVKQSVDERRAFEVEYRLRHKNGSIRYLLERGMPIFSADGKLLYIDGVILDNTDRAQLEAQVRQAQKLEAVGTLAAGIAHDFNNVLAPVIGYTEMVLAELAEDDPNREDLENVLKAADRAKDLVRHVLTFSRQAEQGMEKKPVDLSLIVKESLKFIRASLPTTVNINYDIKPGIALADPTQIQQVLLNLCTNSAHAMFETGGALMVTLTPVELDPAAALLPGLEAGPYVKLTVGDTGHGMDAATLERIFDPYFTTKKKGRGTGLGLAVVHGIVKGHHGAITVRSEVGKGTVFDVYIPRIERDATAMEPIAAPLVGGPESILLVDDERMVVDLGKRMLEQLGYTVVAVTNSFEALQLFRAQPEQFDLVITDFTMPRMTGTDLAREVLQVRADIPVILCTGHSERISETAAKEMGVSAFVMKPLTWREIAELVRGVLDRSAQKRAREQVQHHTDECP